MSIKFLPNKSTNRRGIKINASILLFGITILISCNFNGNKKNQETAERQPIEFPAPLPFNNAESLRIAKACNNWYDSTLGSIGLNGGILIAQNGTILYEKYNGTGHLPGKDSINANTPFHIASVSKTFTAMGILLLKQEGKLQLEDELSKYFPSFNYPGVTIRTLLNHRSGLPNYIYFMESLGWDKNQMVTNEDVLQYLITKKPAIQNIATPNTHFSYCNTNYALLALLIEKISKKKYAAFLKDNFFIPLGMKNSFVFDLSMSKDVSPSYNWKNDVMVFNFLDNVYGDKNIYTTPRDLLQWERLLNSNLIFNKETLAEAYSPYSIEKTGTKNYGLGWRMTIFPNGKKLIYHNGWWHGNNAVFIRMLDENACIIVMGNKFNRGLYKARQLCSLFGSYSVAPDEEEAAAAKSSEKQDFHQLK